MTPRYKDQDYQKLAQAIVDDFIKEDVPLQESYSKVARDLELNAHEARRLLEATNVNAHLSLFEKMGNDHRYVEFTTLDPQNVGEMAFAKTASADRIRGYSAEPVVMDEMAYFNTLDVNEFYDTRKDELEKIAAQVVPTIEDTERGPYEGERGWRAVATLEKTGSELESLLRQKHLVYEESLEKLANYMRRVDAIPFDELEKDAMALHDNAAPVLLKLREYSGRGAGPLEKTANHYVITKNEHRLFGEAVAAYEDCVAYAHGLQWFNQQVGG